MTAKQKAQERRANQQAARTEKYDLTIVKHKAFHRSRTKDSPAVGTRCKHPKFGKGTVIHAQDRQRTVRFDDPLVGIKTISYHELQEQS